MAGVNGHDRLALVVTERQLAAVNFRRTEVVQHQAEGGRREGSQHVGTRCGERAHSLSSSPYGVPSIGRSSSGAGTERGDMPIISIGSQREGSRRTP